MVLGLVLVALVVAAALFEPWRIFTDSTVDEAAPTSATASDPATTSTPVEQR